MSHSVRDSAASVGCRSAEPAQHAQLLKHDADRTLLAETTQCMQQDSTSMDGISVCSARAGAHLAVLLLGMMEWISTKYHILSSGQKSCNSSNIVRHAGKHSGKT